MMRTDELSRGVLLSRRRRSRRARQYSYRLPDWVWGLALGLLVVAVVGGYLAFGRLTGGGGGACDSALAPLPGGAEATAEGFELEDEALGRVIGFLNQGDLDNAFSSFYGDTHAFTHNVDPEVREIDETAARELCEAVIELETELDPPPGTERSPSRMAASATKVRDRVRDAAEVLGFPRPGS
jgi:hypothetical protein